MHAYPQVTLSTVSSRPSISRALVNSPLASSSTPPNKATADHHKDMVRGTCATC